MDVLAVWEEVLVVVQVMVMEVGWAAVSEEVREDMEGAMVWEEASAVAQVGVMAAMVDWGEVSVDLLEMVMDEVVA